MSEVILGFYRGQPHINLLNDNVIYSHVTWPVGGVIEDDEFCC